MPNQRRSNRRQTQEKSDSNNTKKYLLQMCRCLSNILRPCGYDHARNQATFSELPTFVPAISGGKVVKVYDGDTITVAARFPQVIGKLYRFSVRLNGIDTPEIKGHSQAEKEAAQEAKQYLSDKILNQNVVLKSVTLEKYGRLLAEVYYQGEHLNQAMIKEKYAVAYEGGTKSYDWSQPLRGVRI